MRRPLVAVPAYPVAAGRVEGWIDAAVAVPGRYLDALKRAGAQEAVLMPEVVSSDAADDLLDHFDGLLLLGGGDIDPAVYGQEREDSVYGVLGVRDDFELVLARAALRREMPLLAICRGHQVLNVALGGDLNQHITDRSPGHGIPGVEGGAHVRDIDVTAGSRLHAAMRGTRAACSCHHHQAVDRVGNSLRVSARAPDGVVEAVELDGEPWVVGVQWHPEDTAAHDPAQQAIFDTFAAECAASRLR